VAGLIYLLTQATARAAVPPGLAAAAVLHADRTGAFPGSVELLAHKEIVLMFWEKLMAPGLAVAILAAVGSVTWLLGPAIARGLDDKKPDAETIQGEWKLVSAKLMDKDLPDEIKKGFDDKGFVLEKGKMKAPFTGTYTMDATKSPKEIDLTVEEPKDHKGTYLGVYELDGDKLKITFANSGEDRPTKLDPGKDDSWAVLVFERPKK
jgi:uncharacterized protein (TIGR03067 family)